MSGKLFAFNVSKEVGWTDGKTDEQWVGDQTARASGRGYCTGSNYGLDGCLDGANMNYQCYLYGQTGYYICDNY